MKNITAPELKAKLDANESITVIDVREDYERQAGHIPGSLHIALGNIQSAIDVLDNQDAEVVMYCRSGMRSASAAGFLAQNGYTNVANLTGGITAWQAEVDPSVQVG